eukprot:TRINITY_DN15672_c0_g1_i2.p1 TRINITY_DN15672_c0_g1~~TRINITY_DN15672_c0_g1_i2.p1  ORF type:complete len:247 (-),score=29.84 TRINITY_DN15672_c0_g1_i2:44-784(-)
MSQPTSSTHSFVKSFSQFTWKNGFVAELDRVFTTDLLAWCPETNSSLVINGDTSNSHFGFVFSGPATITVTQGTFQLQTGMYFSVNGGLEIQGGYGIIMTRKNYKSFFQLGGPIENFGRLKYIDGCTDSLLIAPIKKGDPCLNLLYFPEGIDQTAHTHPSDRIGIIFSGRGKCITPQEEYDLLPGQIFCIHTNGIHKFQTLQGSPMVVIAYHPDSDFGPTDQDHPMINRTLINGVSASTLVDLQTQ